MIADDTEVDVCQCGNNDTMWLEECATPWCKNTGCEACDFVGWCCNPEDEADGDYFCEDCQEDV